MNISAPSLWSTETIKAIEEHYDATYVCATEHKGIAVEVFYGATEHPVSGSRYFALYKAPLTKELMITDGSFIEDQELDAVLSNEGELIYSRYRHDYRVSKDKSVFIDGGRAYTKSGLYPPDRWFTLIVRDGQLRIKET